MQRRYVWRTLTAVFSLALAFVVIPFAASPASAAATATFTKTSSWGSAFEGKYVITNSGPNVVNGWSLAFDLPSGGAVSSQWDATLTRNGQRFTFSNVGWNGSIPVGGSVSFGFIASPGDATPANCTINGVSCGGGVNPSPSPSPSPSPGGPGKPGTPSVTGTTGSSISISWGASSGTVTGYRVYEGSTQRAQVTGTSATVSGLAACTAKTYTVKAYNTQGESVASDAVSGSTTGCPIGPLPKHFLTGYWHNFVNPATELKLSAVPNEYDLIAVAFAEATSTPGQVTFALDPGLATAVGGYTEAQFKADVQALKARGKKVIISVGGETGRVQVASAAAATQFADSVYAVMQNYGFDGVDIDLENGLNAQWMGDALRQLRSRVGSSLIITMAPQTIDMQSTGMEYFKLALAIKDILTVVHMQYYNSGSMLGCDQAFAYGQGSINFLTALACIQLENGLRDDQVALGLPAGPGAAGGGVVAPSMVNQALTCLATRTNCGSFVPPRAYPGIRGAMTWSINWDASNNWNFSRTVRPHLNTLP
ncbi:chitinase [Herbidospora yilanensis]|uniref:chitinase n=1 Tax=Herbidospora yilanensis TaxID=354426 RepID=UPI000783EDBF|nr:cellulose binding domain-containing protein [Herbidospora yilanensis]